MALKNTLPTKSAKSSKERLKQRIRRTLAKSGLNGKQNVRAMREVEGLTLQLFQDFSLAPKSKKSAVYSRGERKILRTIEKQDKGK
jgi:hypothetical protein